MGQRGGCIAHGERPTCAALRLLAYQVVLAVFSEYDAHRKVLLQDLLEARLTQPTGLTRDARRNYPLPNGARIQTFTALCALLMQSAAKMPPPPPQEEAPSAAPPLPKGKGKGKAAAAPPPAPPALESKEHPHAEVSRLVMGLLRALVYRCLDRSDDAESKALLDEFVRDTLQLVGETQQVGPSDHSPAAARRRWTIAHVSLPFSCRPAGVASGAADRRTARQHFLPLATGAERASFNRHQG